MQSRATVNRADVIAAWWPLAVSWLLMGAEQPGIAAVVARLPEPEVGLGAYGSVVFPIALMIEAPVIMLLAASTELSRDRTAYRRLMGFAHKAGALLTVLHLLIALTPAGEILIQWLLSVPEEVARQARPGLLITLPWTWSIAWRRTNQGLLIRHGRSRLIGLGTGLRLIVSVAVLGTGLVTQAWTGVVVGSTALSVGVLAEGTFIAWQARKVVASDALEVGEDSDVLRGRAFWNFYAPLATMPIIILAIQPAGTAAISRMPHVIASLAVWPVVTGIAFVLQSLGVAYNEVVVAMLRRPQAAAVLRRFAVGLGLALTLVWALLAFTPLSEIWFRDVMNLSPRLTEMAIFAMGLGLPLPAARVAQSWYQGLLVSSRKTRGITEAVIVFAVICGGLLFTGVVWSGTEGVYVAVAGFSAGRIGQTIWLVIRSRNVDAERLADAAVPGTAAP